MPFNRTTIRSTQRSAFTLIELLVAMSIFVILATLTVAGFQGMSAADQVGNSASTLRGAIEGARSRAIKSGEKRGLRLLLDPQDNRLVTSIVYVGAPELVEGHLRVEWDNRGPGDGPFPYVDNTKKWRIFDVSTSVDPENFVDWRGLFQRGLLRRGCKIVIDGNLYHLNERDSTGTSDVWTLDKDFMSCEETPEPPPLPFPEEDRGGFRPLPADPDETADTGNPRIGLETAVASQPLKYRLYLLPAVLEGASPVALPRNTCIDLDGSRVPTSWRPGEIDRRYGPLVAGDPDPRPMDIMFTSRGQLDRELVAEGFLHFRLADRNDIMAARSAGILPNGGNSPTVVRDPEHPGKLVTLVTRTGILRISNVFGEGDLLENGYNNEIADNPFRYAIYGREAKQ